MADSESSSTSTSQASGLAAESGRSLRSEIVEAAPAVRRYLFGMCGHWQDAEDFAQEALLKAWAKRESFDGRANTRTWIFAIARNHWLDRLRRGRVRPQEQPMPDQPIATASSSPPAQVARAELAAAVDAALASLPCEQREALALRESEGVTFRQIAELLGVPPATVKSRVRYALKNLTKQLKDFRRELEA